MLESMNESDRPAPDISRAEDPKHRWHVVAAVLDLMFTAKISAAAKQAGCPVKFVQDEDRVIAALQEIPEGFAPLLIVDLNHLTLNSVNLISKVKANPATAKTPILAYLSHAQAQLKRAAEQAGCDLVLPRSVFSQNIHEILRRQSCHLASL
jgi:CheY-like chemotaxis protein